jgi:predicted RNA-binding Zn-ribbon protein involved in translation (DUF1610 family)
MTDLKDLNRKQTQRLREELLKHRCSCGTLMILFDNNSDCQGYKCPQCGNMEFSLNQEKK